MILRRPSRYYGVTWHRGQQVWIAKFMFNHHLINLGRFTNPELAAWSVDFARCLILGPHQEQWPFRRRMGKLNSSIYPELVRIPGDRTCVIRKLLEHRILQPDILLTRLAEYDSAFTDPSIVEVDSLSV